MRSWNYWGLNLHYKSCKTNKWWEVCACSHSATVGITVIMKVGIWKQKEVTKLTKSNVHVWRFRSVCTTMKSDQCLFGALWVAKDPQLLHMYSKDAEPSLGIQIILFVLMWSDLTRRKHEQPHDKTNKMACAPSEHSDQPGHRPSLIRVVAVH